MRRSRAADGRCMLRVGMTNPPFILEHLAEVAQVLRDPRVFSYLHVPVRRPSTLGRLEARVAAAHFGPGWARGSAVCPRLHSSATHGLVCFSTSSAPHTPWPAVPPCRSSLAVTPCWRA